MSAASVPITAQLLHAIPVSPPFVAPLWGDLFFGVQFWGVASPNESNN